MSSAGGSRRSEELRDRWFNPPAWVERVDELVPGYPKRPAARTDAAANALKARTTTNLHDARPQWLDDARAALDAAVANVVGRDGLPRFPDDGRNAMDATPVGKQIRPVKLTKKDALFAGSDDGTETWASCASLNGACKLNGVIPLPCLSETLCRIVNMHPMPLIDDLMPRNYATTIPGTASRTGRSPGTCP